MSLRSPMDWSPLTLSGTAAMVKPKSLRSWACGASSVKALGALGAVPGDGEDRGRPLRDGDGALGLLGLGGVVLDDGVGLGLAAGGLPQGLGDVLPGVRTVIDDEDGHLELAQALDDLGGRVLSGLGPR